VLSEKPGVLASQILNFDKDSFTALASNYRGEEVLSEEHRKPQSG